MLAWILISGFWIALLLLILHDVTKEDTGGSAVSIGAKNGLAFIRAFIEKALTFLRWSMLQAAKLRTAPVLNIAKTRVSSPPVLETVPEAIPLIPEPAQKAAAIREPTQEPAAPVLEETASPQSAKNSHTAKKKWWRHDQRASIGAPELELAIAEALRKAAPDCEGFAGVIVRQTTPNSRSDANWVLQGVKFGKADRQTIRAALPSIVERMQREYKLTAQ